MGSIFDKINFNFFINIKAITATSISVTANDNAVVQYLITNQSKKSHTLTLTPIAGITQNVTPGNCPNPFTLSYKQSCVLSLLINGSALGGNVIGGPKVCTLGNPLQCYQPSSANSLYIIVNPISEPFISVTPTNLSFIAGESGSVIITNSGSRAAENIAAQIPSGSSITVQSSDCPVSLVPGSSCTIIFTSPTIEGPTNISIQGMNTNQVLLPITVLPVPMTSLTVSVNTLALSVNDIALNAALTGNPRTITISNNGAATAINVVYTPSPALPAGTTIAPAGCGNIAPSATCVLTITPGSTPSAAPGDTTPTPITLTISGDNTNTVSPTINVLTYGSFYQSGYIFSVDDTSASNGSIGGKTMAENDIGSTQVWGPSPITTNANSTSDGASNTATLDALVGYDAADSCANLAIDFTDWYLPAICEMGYNALSGTVNCGTQLAPSEQNIQSNLVDNGNIGNLALATQYWSSTEDPTGLGASFSLFQFFDLGGASFQEIDLKVNALNVRCVRFLTP